MTGDELLAAIPAGLRDVAHPDLLGETPRQVVEAHHVDFSRDDPGCPMCRRVLQRMAEET